MSQVPIRMLIASLLSFFSSDASGDIVADYQFGNSFSSSVVGAPVLEELTAGGAGSFVTDNVAGQSRTAFRFNADSGLRVDTTGLLSNTEYSVGMLFEFDAVSGYRRIMGVKNLAADQALYNYNSGNTVGFFNDDAGSQAFGADTYVEVFMTRNGTTGLTRGYLNGVESFSFLDAGNSTISAANRLVFFKDDAGEETSGTVARIQLFDQELSPAAVAALDLTNFNAAAVPEPSSMLALGLGLLTWAGYHRRRVQA